MLGNQAFGQRPLGVDVSNHQGASINWASVKAGGYTFAWAKATENVNFVDADFAINMNGAKAAGVYIGAYHFARPAVNSPTAEANYFWGVAGPYITNNAMMPMLDMEIFTGVVGASSYSDWANQWCNAIVAKAAAAGVMIKPVIYTSACLACNFDTSVSQWIPWIADYNGQPAQTSTPWTTCTTCEEWGSGVWNVWQYSSTAAVPGVTGNCDVDVFNGTAATFLTALVIGGGGPPPPTITSQPQSLTRNVGSNATFSVSATGTGTLHYQWAFNQTNIAGATAASITISNVQPTNAGSYTVLVTNANGNTPGGPAFLSVVAPLTNSTGCVLAPPNMVNWWTADGNLIDIFSYSNATPHPGFYYASGKQGLAFHFDGASSYLTTGLSSLPVPWTLCFWVNRQNAPGTAAALFGDGTYEIKLEQYNGTRKVGITQFSVADSAYNYIVPASTWTHLAFVGTSTGTSLYVNGAFQSTLTNTLPLPRGYIGAGFVTSGSRIVDYMLGSLDEILTFNRALSATEISGIAAASSAGLVRAPEFMGEQQPGPGQFQLNLRGQTGKAFTIYRSSDLSTWPFLGSAPNPTGSASFTDNSASGQVNFYRATQP